MVESAACRRLRCVPALVLIGLGLLLFGCASLSAPPALPIEKGTVRGGGSASLHAPVRLDAQAAVGLGGGDVYAYARGGVDAAETGIGGRYYLDGGKGPSLRWGIINAIGGEVSVGRATGLVGPPFWGPPSYSEYRQPGEDPPETNYDAWANRTLRWGEAALRVWSLATPEGWFGSFALTGRLESQRPWQAVSQSRTGSGVVKVRAEQADTRAETLRFFVGGTAGYRFQLSPAWGLQLRAEAQVGPFARRPSLGSIAVGVQLDGGFGL